MDDNVIIGVNVLETLTTGMYRDSRVIFREYIQNACDQINRAQKSGLFQSIDDGEVNIWIDYKKRSVSVEDNATGIPAADFRKTLYSIGESPKTIGEDIGFRGIGHWCGLGYCKTLRFTSKTAGETVESLMTCDAEQMRKMMDEHNTQKASYTIDDVLSASVKFETNSVNNQEEHYFKVEMLEIPDLYDELYTLQEIKDYLSFVAPVAYDTPWRFSEEIHRHAKEIGHPIQEYKVTIDGEAVRKKYKPSFTTSKGEDTVDSVHFEDLKDEEGNLIAWLWFGISNFKAVLNKENVMRGIRLRMQNIQLGNEDALQKLFKEDRGQHYFIGEVFSVYKELIPNSQRDYFNPGDARHKFEQNLSELFNYELSHIYKNGSNINSKFDKMQKAVAFQSVMSSATIVTEEMEKDYDKVNDDAINAERDIAKLTQKYSTNSYDVAPKIHEVVTLEIIRKNKERLNSHAGNIHKDNPRIVLPTLPETPTPTSPKPQAQCEDKLISFNTVIRVIRESTDAATAEAIIARIEEESR